MLMGTLGILVSFPLLREGAQPCSGDGCIMQILLLAGIVLIAVGGSFITIGIWLAKPGPNRREASVGTGSVTPNEE